MKKCKCGETKIENFGSDKKRHDGLKPLCKSCHNANNRKLRQAHPEKYRSVNLLYARSAKGKFIQRSNNLRRKFWPNMTNQQAIEEYDRLLREQGNACAICKRHQATLDHTLHVDHCKYTGTIRGLLCMYCNRLFVQDKSYFEVKELMAYFDKYHKDSDA